MKYPAIQKQPSHRVTVPKLDGGLNGCDSVHQVEDNQLTDCLNMWWKDGTLRTRPGAKFKGALTSITGSTYVYKGTIGGKNDTFDSESKMVRKKIILNIVDSSYVQARFLKIDYDGYSEAKSVENLDAVSKNANDVLMLVESSGKQYTNTVENCSMVFTDLKSGYEGIVLGEPSESSWVDLSSNFYVPLVLVNGSGSTANTTLASGGSTYEGYNLLTPKFRAQFTSDGSGIYYALPVKNLDSSAITVTVVNSDGTTSTYTIPAGVGYSDLVNEYRFHVDRVGGYVYSVNSSSVGTPITTTGITNNIEVTAAKTVSGSLGKICAMRFCTWFGGDRSGYNGGTRLFVSGNTSYPNLVHWSDVDNPLYFPENNYAYIGDSGQSVTAFAKQSNMLVIFKEREIYYATYTAGTTITADNITSGNVTDITSQSAYFPITPLHPFIGCDCPNSIQLCENRLVWATSDKKVYALSSSNQYSECTVRDVSRNIETWFSEKTATQFKAAYSGDYCGHYVLMMENDAYIVNYKDNDFTYYVLYSTYNKSQTKIPWYKWSFNVGITLDYMMSYIDKVVLSGYKNNSGLATVYTFVLDNLTYSDYSVENKSNPISSMFQTKEFDFSYPERRKNIQQLYIGLDVENATSVSATYLTEDGETTDISPIVSEDGSGRVFKLTPSLNRIQRFGLRLNSSGSLAVSDLVIKYMLFGGGVR